MYTNNLTYMPFGIDTIGLTINSQYVNYETWAKGAHKKIDRKIRNGQESFNAELIKRIGDSDYLTLVTTRMPLSLVDTYIIRIQQELLFHQMNYIYQITQIFMELAFEGYLRFPECRTNYELFNWIMCNMDNICSLRRLDFYMDFKETDFIQKQSKIRIDDSFINTTYSPDHKDHRSLWACYDRRKKLIAKNQIKHSVIAALPYPIRLEIRYDLHNFCHNLNLQILNGNFFQVATRLCPNIARSWRRYKQDITEGYNITCYNQLFNLIEYWSNQKKIPMCIDEWTL